MPITYPLPSRDNPLTRRRLAAIINAPIPWPTANPAHPGQMMTDDLFHPGYAKRLLHQLLLPQDIKAQQQPSTDLIQGPSARRIFERTPADTRYILSGVSYDCFGAILPGATVRAFSTATNEFLGSVVSDATTGAWTMTVTRGWPLFLVEYLAGTPDRAGTSVNTIIPAIG